MPRPKKKEIQAVERLGQRTSTSSTGDTEKEEESAANLIEEDEHRNRTFVRFTYKTRKKCLAMHGRWEEGLNRCKIIGVERAPPTRRADLGLTEAVLDGRYGC